jgi:hypothetical protein
VIDLQHVFHARYECGVGIRWDDPLLFQVGLNPTASLVLLDVL